ncbi:MAG: glycosyltransferase family 2 protein [Candidatus Curtissbacteria bacterium]|nr:glycosyltransferase family 2 protein [Candidatus Curtissbacteria bacterium]
MKKTQISVALATFNEEENIIDCIESVNKFADEVVIADGASVDRTAEIAEKLGAKVIKTTNKPMFHTNKNLAIDNCHGQWIFLIDADERVSEELAREIKETIKKTPSENGFWINRRNWFLGGYLTKGGAYPDSVIRLFRKGKGRLPEISVHEQVKIKGDVGHLRNDILHLADPNFSRYLTRANRYTSFTASKLKEQNTRTDILTFLYYVLIKPPVTFLKIYFRHRGYKDGFRGFIWALFSGAHHYYAYVKYWHENGTKIR